MFWQYFIVGRRSVLADDSYDSYDNFYDHYDDSSENYDDYSNEYIDDEDDDETTFTITLPSGRGMLFMVRKAFCPRRRPHSGPIEL